jgi:hypothetical protein
MSVRMSTADPYEFIETSSQLKEALGDHLSVIRKLDPLPEERKKTKSLRKELIRQIGERCAFCGSREQVQAAHIVPLEIGSTTNAGNLILLCRKHHSLYDDGHLSMNSMMQVARDWRAGKNLSDDVFVQNVKGKGTMREPSASIRDDLAQVRVFQNQRKLKKASDLLQRKLKSPTTSREDANYLFIKLAEITRRRDAQGVLKQALSYIKRVDMNSLHTKYLSEFQYEDFYIHRLTGSHKKAQRIAELSAKASLKENKDNGPSVLYVAASANELLCELAGNDKPSASRVEYFVAKLDNLERIAEQHGEYWGGRWALNCAAHRLQVYLKARNKRSLLELENLKKLYYEMDISRGWASTSLQSISLLEGLTNVLFSKHSSEISRGVRILARSFVSRLKRTQRFEGIRDAGFGLAVGLRKLGKYSRTVNTLNSVMNRTVDGTSYIWPWKVP